MRLAPRVIFVTTLAMVITMVLTTRSSDAADSMPPFKVGISNQQVATGFEIMFKEGDLHKLKYRPAQSLYFGVILGYKWLGGTLSFASPAEDQIVEKEGKSEYADYRLSYYVRRFGIELNYNRFKGYLLENSSELSDATLAGETYFKLPDLETVGFGGSFIYILDPDRFSLPAAYDQSEIQRRSGGTLLLVTSFRRQVLKNPDAIIPDELQDNYGEDRLFEQGTFNNLGMALGYAFNWVPSSFFFAPLIALGPSYQKATYQLADGKSRTYEAASANLHLRLSLGWNSPHFFFTVVGLADIYSSVTESLRVSNNIQAVTLSLGTRF